MASAATPSPSAPTSVVESTINAAVAAPSKPAVPFSGQLSSMNILNVPISVMTDSYKATHYQQYPDATKMVAVRHKDTSIAYPQLTHPLHAPTCSMASSGGAS